MGAVWSCFCDLYVLAHDGNLADAAVLAMSAAMGSLTLPLVSYDEQSESLLSTWMPGLPPPPSSPLMEGTGKRKRDAASEEMEEGFRRVGLSRLLLPVSFGVLSGRLLVDPTGGEEELLSCAFTVLVDTSGQPCIGRSPSELRGVVAAWQFAGLHKPGGGQLESDLMEQAIAVAKERSVQLHEAIRKPALARNSTTDGSQ
ncbi:MAG: hypothetical protein SGPRY_003448 [Prymnesium sp.]